MITSEQTSTWIALTDDKSYPPVPHLDLVTKTLLFVADGKVYAGNYHINGCFYSDNPLYIAAHTKMAVRKSGREGLPKSVATHWMPLPESPVEKLDT